MRSPSTERNYMTNSLFLLWVRKLTPTTQRNWPLEKLLWKSDGSSKAFAQKNVNLHRDIKYCLEFQESRALWNPPTNSKIRALNKEPPMTLLKTGKILSSDFVSLKCNKFKNLKKAKKEVFSFNSSAFWLKTKCYKTNKPQTWRGGSLLAAKSPNKNMLRARACVGRMGKRKGGT